jgi:hypothetical protein
VVRVAPQQLADAVELPVREAERAVERFRDLAQRSIVSAEPDDYALGVGPIVRRESEIAVVYAFLADDDRGARALAIVGAPGLGKTTVWQAGVERARAAGYRVLSARPSGAEASLAFAGLSDLLALG